MIQDARPRNTLVAHKPKQKEFRDFCERKQYQDADTVTEDKLLLFLVEEVADRPLRAKSRKAAENTPQEATRLAWISVRSYTTAITDLYHAQKALGINTHPSPRENNVQSTSSPSSAGMHSRIRPATPIRAVIPSSIGIQSRNSNASATSSGRIAALLPSATCGLS
jgi:hypothetical protein